MIVGNVWNIMNEMNVQMFKVLYSDSKARVKDSIIIESNIILYLHKYVYGKVKRERSGINFKTIVPQQGT